MCQNPMPGSQNFWVQNHTAHGSHTAQGPLSETRPEPQGSERSRFSPWSVGEAVAQPTVHIPQKVPQAFVLVPGSFQRHHRLLGHLPPPLPPPEGDEEARLAALVTIPCCPAGRSTWGPRGRPGRPGTAELPGA